MEAETAQQLAQLSRMVVAGVMCAGEALVGGTLLVSVVLIMVERERIGGDSGLEDKPMDAEGGGRDDDEGGEDDDPEEGEEDEERASEGREDDHGNLPNECNGNGNDAKRSRARGGSGGAEENGDEEDDDDEGDDRDEDDEDDGDEEDEEEDEEYEEALQPPKKRKK